ncbi:MAG: 50S ribosomal protein L25 [Firmicutes bacterium]|nr:50S ribosomal protein L25 [Bacillota bacterium]
MESVKLEGIARKKESKGELKEKRRKGLVPGVIYGRGSDTESIYVDANALKKSLLTPAGLNVLIELEVKGDGEQKKETVMIKELQRDLLRKEELLHVDFYRISLKEKIEVDVPLNFVGEPAGVKEGGILAVQLREVSLKCLPTEIPEKLDVNIENLAMGQSLFVSDLEIPEGLELLTDPEESVVSVQAPTVAVEELEGEEVEEGEGAAEKEAAREEEKEE